MHVPWQQARSAVRVGAAAAAFALTAFARPAVARESYAYRLAYDAPDDCPSKAAFSIAIESNSARAHAARPGEAAIYVDVRIAPQGDGYEGTLNLRRRDASETTRTVPAARCTEVVSAIALIVTIAIDPDAAPPSVAAPSSAAARTAPPSLAATAPPSTTPPPTVAVGAAPASENPPIAPDRDRNGSREPSPRRPRPWWLAVNAGAAAASALSPGISPDFGLGVSLGTARKALLSPLLLASGQLSESLDSSHAEGTAQFQRLAGRLTGCPIAGSVGPFLLRPCALFEVGQLRAKGSNASHPLTARILWLALGAVGRAELPLAGPLTLAAELGALFPLKDDSFYFNPSRASIYQVPPVGFVGGLELTVHIL